jgi:hypothetical protein
MYSTGTAIPYSTEVATTRKAFVMETAVWALFVTQAPTRQFQHIVQAGTEIGTKHVDLVGPSFLELKMILRSALVAISLLPALISGGRVPAVNQVIGGVPRTGENAIKAAKRVPALADVKAQSERHPTPGKLRVVENSGVCGAVILFTTYWTTYPCCIDGFGRNYEGCLSGLWIW